MPTELRKKVLVVDDEKMSRSILSHNIVLAGYEVITATNGQEAMEKIKEITPDLIVVDLVMPDMNGFELCRQIRTYEQTATTPVIVVSGLQSRTDAEEAKSSGADMCLTKPIKPEEFIGHVKRFLPSPFKV